MRRWIIAAAFLLLGVLGCGPQQIAGTMVADTPENRVIAELVERYRQAVERRDVPGIKEMVSRRYFSNAGTTADTSDDYGYEMVEQKLLPLLASDVKSVQFAIILRKVTISGETAMADFEYSRKFYYVDAGKDRWHSKADFGRLTFVREGDVWRIIDGL